MSEFIKLKGKKKMEKKETDYKKPEYEERILDILDKGSLEKLLQELGATKIKERFKQRRYTYNTVDAEDQSKWIRVRTNGEQTTMCYKEKTSTRIGGTGEIEFPVPDFEQANSFLKHIGLPPKQYQENFRTQYLLDGVEIDIDEWPLIPAYIEIEGKNEQEVIDTINKLGLQNHRRTTKSPEVIYKDYYEIDIMEISDLRFPDSNKEQEQK